MKFSSILRATILLVLVSWVIWFFVGETQRHWNELSRVRMVFRWQYILVGELLVFVDYLVVTLAWRDAILLASNKKFTFVESVGLVNISQLSKYLPGKVWSYAIQMHLLSAHDIAKACVLSVNVIMLLSLVTSATVIGLGYLVFANTYLPQSVALALLAASLAFYVFLFFGGTWSANVLMRLTNRLFKTRLATIKVPTGGMVIVHGLFLASNLSFGLAGYCIAVGIGLPPDLTLIAPIAATMLLSNTIGLFAFFAPGGIGVREGVMYAMLKSAVDIQTCFILPIAFRLVTTICDLLLGSVAFVLLNRYAQKSGNQPHFKTRVAKIGE